MENIIISSGDYITLYSFDNNDIIEFKIGDNSFSGLDSLCIGKRRNDIISFCGETFVIQYIYKNKRFKSLPKEDIKVDTVNKKVINKKAKKQINGTPIDVQDFIVRTSLNRCTFSNHSITPVNALVCIMNQGVIKEYSFPGMYCPKCDKYYIYEHIYQEMKRKGYICCKVIKVSELTQYEENDKDNPFNTWQDKSILNLYGYTVDKNKNLANKDRHQILAFIIENNILSTQKVVNYLQGFIMLRKNNKNMKAAISKWQDDINYVLNYKKSNRNIRINSLTTR